MFEKKLDELLISELQAYDLLNFIENAEFEIELINFTKSGFREAIWRTFPSQESKSKVMLGLTFIALKYYNGALWPHVFDKYMSINQDSKLLESKIRDNVLGLLTSKYNCERKHYQIPVMNAVVPFNYASNYIEFVNDVYVKNLDCDLSLYNIDEELDNVFNSIGKNLSDTDDSFKYNYEQNNTKVYKLIRATKNIIKTGIKRSELILFTKDILKKLDAYYKGKNVSSSYYIDESFKQWLSYNQDNETLRTRTKTNFTKSKFPYFTYLNTSGNVYLHTPTKRLFGEYNPKKFSIEILENGQTLFKENNLKFNYLMGGIEIVQCNYKIENPLNKIRCKIYYEDQAIYDSKEFLYRDYFLFDDDKELKNNKIYNGLVYFIYKNFCDVKLTKLKDCISYKIAYTSVKENDEYEIDGKHTISFSNVIKPGIIGEQIPELEILEQNVSLPIFKKINNICLTSQNTNNFANKIKINDELVDITHATEIINQTSSISYIINIENLNLASGVYSLELIDIQQNKCQSRHKFMYDPNIDVNERLISDFSVGFSYVGSYEIIDKANRKYNNFVLLINDLDRKKLYFDIDGELYKCKFNLTIPYFQVDNGCVNTFNHYLTSEDFTAQSRLFFNIDNCDKILFKADDYINELSIKVLNKKTYFELSELINYKQCKLIEISFISGNVEKQFLKIYNDVVFDTNESYFAIDSLNEEVEFKTVINGRKTSDEVYIQLSTRNGIVGQEKVDAINNINVFKLGKIIQKIHYYVYRNIKELVGFKVVDKQDVICEGNFAYYPFADLINKYLVIDKVLLENAEEDSQFLETKYLNLKLVKRFNEFYYLGYLYNNKQGKITSFDKIGEVLINLSQIYRSERFYCCDADICIYYDDSFKDDDPWTDYLQYDETNKTIINGVKKNTPYISKYRINLTLGEKQYADFKSNRKS